MGRRHVFNRWLTRTGDERPITAIENTFGILSPDENMFVFRIAPYKLWLAGGMPLRMSCYLNRN